MLQIGGLRHSVTEILIDAGGSPWKSAIFALARFLLIKRKPQRGIIVTKTCLLILAGLALAGCIQINVADRRDSRENRPLTAFDKLQASRGVEVSLRCGPVPSAHLTGDEEDLANTEISVEDGVLTVRRASMMGGYAHTVHVEVTAPGPLVRLAAGSGAGIEAPACVISSDRLDLDASSGATIHLAAEVRRLTAETGSGATIRPLKGTRIDVSDAEIDAGSGSTVRLCRVGKLQASASSGATISAESIGAGDSHSRFGGSISLETCG